MPVAPDGHTTVPYAVDTLREPLNSAQRTAIIAYFKSPAGKSHTAKQIAKYIDPSPQAINSSDNLTIAFYIGSGKNSHNENMDGAIITAYNNVVKGGDFTTTKPGDTHTEITNPFSNVTDAARALIGAVTSKNFWIRTAEFGVGAILIAVAVNKAIGNPAGKAVKYVK